MVSSPERALLEVLDELPDHESFETVDKLVESLSTLSPRRMQTLLQACQSVKAKRLFFFFADRQSHAWKNKINKDHVDLGSGKRMLVKGGVLDRTYQITVPKGLDAV
ncbi:type IV toxin-antitoxin system AbiEi family antitoxin domain-containing protein [Bradyrhizobium sp. DASA03120]|uniref:type IV toxin-antitoxin system AbiEi family antitoxin domain-containing protein n=1 Tax=Bradyrhizobium sp. SMVTL-02 TaxID=3395917 RepID=UPI003F710933